MTILVLVHAVATLLMVGIIWFVQVVHYPLMKLAGAADFPAYEAAHARRTSYIVGPPMIGEAITAGLLVWQPPSAEAAMLTRLGLALLVVIWTSTACLQVPCHRRLAAGFDADEHRRLVAGNWIRTAAWTLRGGIAVWLVTSLGATG
ncbi:MAG: hypothetical protein QNL91_14615 [Candidatus Krumholzibacteria bacterium]|nr:hypothetical protein [Candidatus Krumholzibacteria bacterium]